MVHVLSVGGDADLMHVGLAHQHGAGCAQPGSDVRILFGGLRTKELRPDGSGIGHLIDLVLDRQRYTFQQAARLTNLQPFSRFFCLPADILG